MEKRIVTLSSILAWWIPYTEEPGKLQSVCLVAQSCPLYDSPPCSSVNGILQARILEWVAKPSSVYSRWGYKESNITKQLTLSLSQHLLSHIAKRAYLNLDNEKRKRSKIAISEMKWMASNRSVWKHCRKWICTWFSWVDTPFNEVDRGRKNQWER